jgi:hypothetical protein
MGPLSFPHEPVDFQQEGVHFPGPRLILDFVKECQFPQEMSVTQAVEAAFHGEVGRPAVVDEPSLEPLEDAEGLKGLAAPLGVDAVPGQKACGKAVEPMESACHPRARFIGVGQFGFLEQALGLGLETIKV